MKTLYKYEDKVFLAEGNIKRELDAIDIEVIQVVDDNVIDNIYIIYDDIQIDSGNRDGGYSNLWGFPVDEMLASGMNIETVKEKIRSISERIYFDEIFKMNKKGIYKTWSDVDAVALANIHRSAVHDTYYNKGIDHWISWGIYGANICKGMDHIKRLAYKLGLDFSLLAKAVYLELHQDDETDSNDHDVITSDHDDETVDTQDSSDHDVITSDHPFDHLFDPITYRFEIGDIVEFVPKQGKPYRYRVVNRTDHTIYTETSSGYKKSFRIKKNAFRFGCDDKDETISTYNAEVRASTLRRVKHGKREAA